MRKAISSGWGLGKNLERLWGYEYEGNQWQAAVQSSRHKYVVMERDKFYFNDSYKFAHFDDISGIVTDEFPDETIVHALEIAGVRLI